MKDNETIKAIEYCSSDEGCIRAIGRLALDIIRRQKAEIEKKNVEIDILINLTEALKGGAE
jgi:hypothetical protein